MDAHDEDPDLALDIPVRAISEELCCPICFSPIQQCVITPCGHNFCDKCISECLNIKHSCPCCNKETVKNQLIRNHHFDKIVEIVLVEKEKASKKYFERLINRPVVPDLSQSQELQPAAFSPIEQLFHKHMKRSLMSYEEYYKEIHEKYRTQCSEVQAHYTNLLTNNSNKLERKLRRIAKGASDRNPEQTKARSEAKSKKLQDECNKKLKNLEEGFNESVKLLMDVYDKYMQGFAPVKEFLPVVITIKVKDSAVLHNVSISRTDGLTEIQQVVERRLAEQGNPINSWGKTIKYTLVDAIDEKIPITDERLPLVQYGAQQGSTLLIEGSVLLQSDQPKVCFTHNFEKGVSTTDYFTCKDCKINWVCADCAAVCHKGHTIVDYLKDHKPTWNCCYCVKRKKCTLPNKNTK